MKTLEKKFRSKTAFTIQRFINFIKLFLRNKRGVLGVSIIVFFTIIALGGPLIAPHDPVKEKYVAGDYAMPEWFKYFPGKENLNENFILVDDPGFTTLGSLEKEWKFTTTDPHIKLRYNSTFGNKKAGCVEFSFKRDPTEPNLGEVHANLSKSFSYPSKAPPRRFQVELSVYAKGVEKLGRLAIRVFILQVDGNETIIWAPTISNTTTQWITPGPPYGSKIDSYDTEFKKWIGKGDITVDPSQIVFSKPADYIFCLDIGFEDYEKSEQKIEVSVYIDDVNLKLYGNIYGLLGTDMWGRDIYSQLIIGTQISLLVGLLSAVLSVVIGLGVGLLAGYSGGISDQLLMRFTDALLVLPGLPLLLVLIAVIGPSIWNLIVIIGVLGWMGFARTVRSQVLSLKERPFVEAAKSVGAGKFYIIERHILPNVMSLVYVSLALSVPSAILSEAALSWLGLFDPSVMSWGRMLYDVQVWEGIEKWWWVIPPGLAIALLSISFILIGYSLDEILNPRLRRRL